MSQIPRGGDAATGGLRPALDRLVRVARNAQGPFIGSERELIAALTAAEEELAKPRPIRVLRLLEYTYDDVQTYEKDRQRWYIQEGRTVNPRVTIRSTTLPLEVLEDPPELVEPEPAGDPVRPIPIQPE